MQSIVKTLVKKKISLTHVFEIGENFSRNIYLFEDRERESFHLLVQSPDGCNNWSWARTKQGARNSYWIGLVDGRGSKIWTNLHCLPRSISRVLELK